MAERLVISEKEKESVIRLHAPKRYSYFIKRVGDWESAWGLWQDGWALVGDDADRTAFPLWPAREFAEACASGPWANYEPEEITLDDLLGELLPQLEKDDVSAAIFPTPSDRGMLVRPSTLAKNLSSESEQYE